MQNIERVISVFSRQNESIVKEINVSLISLEILRNIFKPTSDDNDLSYVYPIGQAEAVHLKNIINIDFDFDNFIYQLDCFSQ